MTDDHSSKPEPGLPDSRPHIDALTGIRAVAALWVLLLHLDDDLINLVPALEFLRPLADAGILGVDLFFVLSGFVIAYNYLDRLSPFRWRAYLRYLGLRLARIYPLHLATMLMLAVMVGVAAWRGIPYERDAYPLDTFVLKLFMVDAWVLNHHSTWNIPAWSISAEWFAYLLIFPMLGIMLRKTAGRTLLLALTALVVLAYPALHEAFGIRWWMTLVRIACGFSAGYFLYLLYRAGTQRPNRWAWCEFAIPAIVIAWLYLDYSLWGVGIVWGTLLFAPAIYALSCSRGPVARLLATRPAVYLGRISYALYMTQAVLLKALQHVLPSEDATQGGLVWRAGVFLIYALAPLAVAALAYHLVEHPARKLLRTWMDVRRAA